tara:strand:+ start:12799 stop:12960 length:162 start_codon:yes stop_codon:yes gene_type:complete
MGSIISCCCKKSEETNMVSNSNEYFDFSEVSYILEKNEKNKMKSKENQDTIEV